MFHIMNAMWHEAHVVTDERIFVEAMRYQCTSFTNNFGFTVS